MSPPNVKLGIDRLHPKDQRSVNRNASRQGAVLDPGAGTGSLGGVSRERRTSPDVTRLIDRIRKLVAEQRRLRERANRERLEANRREIERLQRRLAHVVRRELAP
jgi:hypothetical protein